MNSEFRQDNLLNKNVIITPTRPRRPRDISEKPVVPRSAPCLFCPAAVKPKTVIDKINNGHWQTLSLPNNYPAVSLTNAKAYGAQEVIIDTPKHGVELGELNESEILAVLTMYQRRTAALSKIKGLDYVLIFKNNGARAGASIAHAHSQVFATNIIPPDVQEEITAAIRYQTKHRRNAYADITAKELKGRA